MSIKDNGVYYTPSVLSEFMVKHSISNLPAKGGLAILEPSCGEGVFVDAVSSQVARTQTSLCSLDCVDIDQNAIEKVREKSIDQFDHVNIHTLSFLDFQQREKKKYDLILGNPPYVVRKRLSDDTIEKCKAVYRASGLNEKSFKNLWGAFLVASIKLLAPTGVLAFVLPAELLQVKFSGELRRLLISQFQRVEVISFQHIIFDKIEQDTILLFCYQQHSEPGLFFDHQQDIDSLVTKPLAFQIKDPKKIGDHKWTGHVLTEEELELISALKEKFKPVSHYCTAVAGIVTAANNYFIVDDDTVQKYELESFIVPIVQKGLYINGSATFTSDHLLGLKERGLACNLVSFQGCDESSLGKKTREYLELGRTLDIHERYKCKGRSPWYAVPGVWKSEGFFFKRSYLYPKLLANIAESMVTDSAYRIKMLDDYGINSLVYSFYNSLSLSIAELEGRFYGGGVLELTPNEFKSVMIPYTPIEDSAFSSFVSEFEEKPNIEDFLASSDREILINAHGLSEFEVTTLQEIHRKLVSRRLNKRAAESGLDRRAHKERLEGSVPH